MLTKKRIMVTGGAGFVGSNLCRYLLEKGSIVDCVDNLITGRRESISALEENESFQFFETDISDPDFVSMFKENNYDEVLHLACPTGVPNIAPMAEEMLVTCSTGTDNVLKLAHNNNAKLVYTSSAEVYGDPEVFPQTECYNGNVDPVGPRSAYEEGKRFSESLVSMYAKKYQVPARIVRLFNTFGTGMSPDDTRVIPQFLKQIRLGQKITIYGDGNQNRAHMHVNDLIQALMLVMEKGTPGEVYNIGGSTQMTIRELAELIDSLTPMPVDIEYRPHFIEDHGGRLPDTTKVRKLGWAPCISTTEGLLEMMPNYGVMTHEPDLLLFEESPKIQGVS
ncbi:MAG TPA: NAD-dependent epimerase/dehydratase family protein [Chromatiales bacterium]|nr:NAD-dependent epimerase/dehydratase family protein [Thiotrichales bacterium]HIP69503.1 NAD-dependent epimerase/dehydratase family protein [Chromatiales bacterium]